MIRLPASLIRRLEKLFPKASDRERFVASAVEDALRESGDLEITGTESVGGTLHLFTDGGSRGNPGEAAVGCVLLDPLSGKVLKEYKEAIGVHTNNVAEYKALIIGLELAQKFHPNRLVCHLDSELIVRQLSGEYRVKMPTLQPLVDEIQDILQEFKEVSFRHIPRAQNAKADKLVNQALDSKHA
jgi:ribonuclease HI